MRSRIAVCLTAGMRHRRLDHQASRDRDAFHQYSLTFLTDLGRDLLTSRDVIDLVFAQILRAASEQWFAVTAYSVLPDQVQLLVDGRADWCDGHDFVSTAKRYSSVAYRERVGGRLWQPHDRVRVIRDRALTRAVARHILLAPVRAGLVQRAEEYLFGGSLTHDIHELLDEMDVMAGPPER